MTTVRKRTYLQFRATDELLRRAGIAACLASRKRQARVEEGTLAREFTLAGVDGMIAAATPEELAQAEIDLAERERLVAERKEAKLSIGQRSGQDRRRRERRVEPVGAGTE